jgi:hypothetical protein
MGPVRTRFRRPRRDRAGTRGAETTPTDSPGLASSACRLMEQKSPVAERLRRRSAYPQRGQSSPGVHCRSRLVRCAHRAAPLRGRRRGTRCRERRRAHHSRRTHALALILDPGPRPAGIASVAEWMAPSPGRHNRAGCADDGAYWVVHGSAGSHRPGRGRANTGTQFHWAGSPPNPGCGCAGRGWPRVASYHPLALADGRPPQPPMRCLMPAVFRTVAPRPGCGDCLRAGAWRWSTTDRVRRCDGLGSPHRCFGCIPQLGLDRAQ